MNKERLNVYITTLPRSGSTLLGMILGSHSRICHIGESSYWGKLHPINVRCSCGKIECNFLLRVHREITGFSEICSIYKACSIIDKIEEPEKVYHALSLPSNSFPECTDAKKLDEELALSVKGLEHLANAFRLISGKKIIVDNTKAIRMAERLVTRNDWKVLLLTRDPRGLANSTKKSGIRKNVPRALQMKIPVHIDFAKRALNLLEEKNVLWVRYEDICKSPAKAISKICLFIGVDFERDMLKFKAKSEHTLMGNRMRFDDDELIVEDLSWISGLTVEERKLISENSEMTYLYSKLGYKLAE